MDSLARYSTKVVTGNSKDGASTLKSGFVVRKDSISTLPMNLS